jgi:hypothetical protein
VCQLLGQSESVPASGRQISMQRHQRRDGIVSFAVRLRGSKPPPLARASEVSHSRGRPRLDRIPLWFPHQAVHNPENRRPFLGIVHPPR